MKPNLPPLVYIRLTQKMARTKKRIEYEDMIDGIRALRRAAKEKLTEYYVEKDTQAVRGMDGKFGLLF